MFMLSIFLFVFSRSLFLWRPGRAVLPDSGFSWVSSHIVLIKSVREQYYNVQACSRPPTFKQNLFSEVLKKNSLKQKDYENINKTKVKYEVQGDSLQPPHST